MTYVEMIKLIENTNSIQHRSNESTPHGNNLIHQLKKAKFNETDLNLIVDKYIQTRFPIEKSESIESYISRIVHEVNEYMNYLSSLSTVYFSHQTDFTSSIVPEMLCSIFSAILDKYEIGLSVSAQKNLTIECTFDITKHDLIQLKKKRVDVAVFKPCELSLNCSVEESFPIPLLAIECKTNVDKNMLSGIEQSVYDLKKTFPSCTYLVISELSDFDSKKTNYASSYIDEIYILRKQKRCAVRHDLKARNNISLDLVLEIANYLINGLNKISKDDIPLIDRMQNGKLIGRNTE